MAASQGLQEYLSQTLQICEEKKNSPKNLSPKSSHRTGSPVQIHSAWVAWKTSSQKFVLRWSQVSRNPRNLTAANKNSPEKPTFNIDLQEAPQINIQKTEYTFKSHNTQEQEPAEPPPPKIGQQRLQILELPNIKYKTIMLKEIKIALDEYETRNY